MILCMFIIGMWAAIVLLGGTAILNLFHVQIPRNIEITFGVLPLDYYITLDLLRSLQWLIPTFIISGLLLVAVIITRIATFIEWKYVHVRYYMPEIIRVQMGDLENQVKNLKQDVEYWKNRAEEQNTLVVAVDRRLAQLQQLTQMIQSEDEIRKRRSRA